MWETDGLEIRAYLGFAILMGFNKVPDLYDYWSTSPIFPYFPVASRIPRKVSGYTDCDEIFRIAAPILAL